MEWFAGATYSDAKGNMYHIAPSSAGEGGSTAYRARKYFRYKTGARSLPGCPWRMTAEEAQRDLDKLADKRGWREGL